MPQRERLAFGEDLFQRVVVKRCLSFMLKKMA
jgi:hypothetical protein